MAEKLKMSVETLDDKREGLLRKRDKFLPSAWLGFAISLIIGITFRSIPVFAVVLILSIGVVAGLYYFLFQSPYNSLKIKFK